MSKDLFVFIYLKFMVNEKFALLKGNLLLPRVCNWRPAHKEGFFQLIAAPVSQSRQVFQTRQGFCNPVRLLKRKGFCLKGRLCCA